MTFNVNIFNTLPDKFRHQNYKCQNECYSQSTKDSYYIFHSQCIKSSSKAILHIYDSVCICIRVRELTCLFVSLCLYHILSLIPDSISFFMLKKNTFIHELELNMGLLIVEELCVWKPLCPGQHHLSIEEVWPYLHYAALVT